MLVRALLNARAHRSLHSVVTHDSVEHCVGAPAGARYGRAIALYRRPEYGAAVLGGRTL